MPFTCGGVVCRDPGAGLLGPKKVDGLMRGYELSDGGGTPSGYVCVDEAKEAWGFVEGSTVGEGAPLPLLITPPAAKTAGGIA